MFEYLPERPLEPPEEKPIAYCDYCGGEIYEGETYLEMHNGDIVLDDMETIVEWAREHATAKVAERG